MKYDLIVIGGGPAGYLGAERAGEKGLKTLLIEKKNLGGVCLNEGCIPSKTLLKSAKIYENASKGSKYGVEVEGISLNHKKVLKRKNKVVQTLTSGVRSQLQAKGVNIINGYGKIIGKDSDGYQVKVEDDTYSGKRLLIATGSQPLIPPIPGLEEGINREFVYTGQQILDLQEVPESLAVIGGGYIGLELGSYFNSIGSEVTVIEMLDHIAGDTDQDISNILRNEYKNKGINFRLNSRVVEITDNKIIYEKKGEKLECNAEKALLSVGRSPSIEGIGLDNINIETENGHIKVDEKGLTNQPGVYAAGDVNGYSMLAHTAYREAEVCINNMTTDKSDIMRYKAIPAVIYTDPEVAAVGMTEKTAQEQGIDYETAELSMNYSGRYLAENEGGQGICKVLKENKHNKLIGVHMIGNYASEIIYGAAMMIENEMRVQDIQELVFPHPTVSEIIREGVFRL